MVKVLIVEDDMLLGRVLRDRLINGGVEAVLSQSVSNSITILSENSILLVYLDINLGSENGLDLLRHIKQTPQLKNTNVIIISNEGQLERLDTAKELGASDFLVKSAINIDNFVSLTKNKLSLG